MSIILKRAARSLPEYKSIKRLYHTAFPPEERPPFALLMSRTGREDVDFWAVYRNNKWVGFAYVLSGKGISYLFYLAVAEEERGKGHGGAILRVLKKMYEGQRFFLALEELDESAPNYGERVKRRQFYLNNGLVPLGCKLREGSMIYDVMGIGGEVEPWEYKELMQSFTGKLLGKLVKMEIIPKGTKK